MSATEATAIDRAHPFQTAAEILHADNLDLAVQASEGDVTLAQVQVLRKTLCAKFSPEQLMLYLTVCHRKGVDPFTEAYGFPSSEGGLSFGLRIAGMRALARRAAPYSRKLSLLFKPGDESVVIGARCEIHRKGDPEPFVSEVLLSEYHKGGMWDRMPEVMIKKVAEATCLRAAYPDALSGIYEVTEIRQDEANGAGSED